MILLPQRKKSSEQIARLRESLGILGLAPGEPPASPLHPSTPSSEIPAKPALAPISHASHATPLTPLPAHAQHGPKTLLSLIRSNRIPALPLDDRHPVAPPAAAMAPPAMAPPTMAPPANTRKPVRSLRKSEQFPLPVMPQAPPAANSNLPSHRHSDQEIAEFRRLEALALLTPGLKPKLAAAHPALLIPGYLAALIGAGSICFYQQPLTVSAPCAAASLLIALFIALYKPLSRHHAAFIAVITLLLIVFGALHYFPQLRHAT